MKNIRNCLYLLFVLCSAFSFSYAEKCDHVGVALYKTLGCNPKSFDSNQCPTEYECDFLEHKDVCHIGGKELKNGEKIIPSDIACNGECTCNIQPEKEPSFRCHASACNLTGMDDKAMGPDCYRTYELEQCCPTGVKCRGKDEIAKCMIEGEELEEGIGKDLKNSCEYCICTKEGPKCQSNGCGTYALLYQRNELNKHCAPVYLKDGGYPKGLLCCHHRFYCPDGTEDIKSSDVPNPEAKNCDHEGVSLYKTLGCNPKSFDSDNCPAEYKCDFPEGKDVCYFKGKELKNGEKVFPSEAPCNGECTCIIDPEKEPTFRCQFSGCNLTLLDDKSIGPDCYRTYELGQCCPKGVKCRGKDEITKCKIEGEELEEGKGRHLKHSCGYCVCTKEGPKCQPNGCGTYAQLYQQTEMRKYCAPVYLKDGGYPKGLLCCHHRFYCPDGTEDIKPSNISNPEGKTCKLGDRVLNLGDTFYTKVGYPGLIYWSIKCTCRLPPFVTCAEETSKDHPGANVNTLDF